MSSCICFCVSYSIWCFKISHQSWVWSLNETFTAIHYLNIFHEALHLGAPSMCWWWVKLQSKNKGKTTFFCAHECWNSHKWTPELSSNRISACMLNIFCKIRVYGGSTTLKWRLFNDNFCASNAKQKYAY